MRLPACWRDPEILVKKAMYVAKKATMIIVDDVESNRVILTQFFKEDYTVLEACNGREALQIIENQPVDIILLDLVMPVMDGFELLALLKKNEKYVNIPVVVMTARNEGDSEIRAMEMGAADFIKNHTTQRSSAAVYEMSWRASRMNGASWSRRRRSRRLSPCIIT